MTKVVDTFAAGSQGGTGFESLNVEFPGDLVAGVDVRSGSVNTAAIRSEATASVVLPNIGERIRRLHLEALPPASLEGDLTQYLKRAGSLHL